MNLAGISALARQLVAFDPVLADDVATLLRTQAEALSRAGEIGRLEEKERARRYNTLVEMIEREQAVRPLQAEKPSP